jgi:hypothetical protein
MNDTPVDPTELAPPAAQAATTDAVAPAVSDAGDSPAKPYRVPLRIEVIDRTYAAILAVKTPAQRLEMASASHRTARILVSNRVRELFPNSSHKMLQMEYLKRLLGNGADRYLKACGSDI